MPTATETQIIFGLYDAFYLRAPDQEGYLYWKAQIGEGKQSVIGLSDSFYNQNYSKNVLGYPAMNDDTFVKAIYANVLDGSGTDAPAQSEVDYWTTYLKTHSRGDFVVTFITAAIQFDTTTITDPAKKLIAEHRQDTLLNRLAVAETFMTTLGAETNVSATAAADQNLLPSDPAFQAAQKIISGVTYDDVTMNRAEAFIASIKTDADPMGAIKNATTDQIFGGGGGQDFTLTTGQDIWTGGALDDVVRGVAGVPVGGQDQTTLNSSDVLTGGEGNDKLVVNMTGPLYNGGATINGIETLQIGADIAAATFNMNVNQGQYEVVGTNKVIADQITTGEVLTVQNIVPTASGPGTVTPTLSWENEAGSRAGTFAATYRQESITGTADNQMVNLKNINAMNAGDGILNIAGGMETITIESTGTVTNNTLNNSANLDTGNNAVAADIVSSGSLTKVVLTGGVAIGKAAGVVTDTTGARAPFFGLTDRAIGVDTGLTPDSTTNATESNLLSVDPRVTEVDASAMTGAANVRFVAKLNNVATDVTFKGGHGNDYVEFELGAVKATGGEGTDTFAFINVGTNSSFGSTDSIEGGTGVDTIQLGVNGQVQTYNIGPTEFNNKSSIEVLDLRGQFDNVTLSQEFVSKADQKITVRTDKAVQTSATNPDNDLTNTPAATLLLEDRMVTQLDTTNLDQNTGLIYLGGSGSDRLILDNESFNQYVELNGGANRGQGAVAGAGDYDTLTVRDSAVVDRGDLANVKNFEGLVLVKTQASAQYTIELSEAFLLNNTAVLNDASAAYPDTDIRDMTFFIGTSNAANSFILGAGDTVNVDITDLLNGAALKTSLTGRGLDLTSLVAAGVTINYLVNGAAATAAQIAAVTQNDAVGPRDNVIVSSAAYPGTPPIFFTGGPADETVTLVAPTNSVDMDGGNDTVNVPAGFALTGTLNGGTGTDTLALGAGASTVGATLISLETLQLSGPATMTAAQYAGFTSANAGTGADVLTLSTAGVGLQAYDAIENYVLANGTNAITLGAGGTAQNIFGGTGNDTVITGPAGLANKTIALGGGTADALTITGLLPTTFTLAAAGATGAAVTGTEIVNFASGLVAGVGWVQMFGGAATINLTGVGGDTAATDQLRLGTGGQTVVLTNNVGGYTLTGNTGSDGFNLTAATGGPANVIDEQSVQRSLVTAFDTITGFRAGVDKIDSTTAGAGSLTTINNSASVALVDLAGTISAAVNAATTLAAANWNAAGDALIVNIAAGTAAGSYLVVNESGGAVFDATQELVVKLVGTVGVITLADII